MNPLEDATEGKMLRRVHSQGFSKLTGDDLEISSMLAHFVDCRNLGIPIDVATAVQGASSPHVADEAASLMLVAELLLSAG
jgi:hypothetical protein